MADGEAQGSKRPMQSKRAELGSQGEAPWPHPITPSSAQAELQVLHTAVPLLPHNSLRFGSLVPWDLIDHIGKTPLHGDARPQTQGSGRLCYLSPLHPKQVAPPPSGTMLWCVGDRAHKMDEQYIKKATINRKKRIPVIKVQGLWVQFWVSKGK
jgi:hypothetical protein